MFIIYNYVIPKANGGLTNKLKLIISLDTFTQMKSYARMEMNFG